MSMATYALSGQHIKIHIIFAFLYFDMKTAEILPDWKLCSAHGRSSVRTHKFKCAKFYFHECQVRTWPVKDKGIKLLHAQKQVLGAHNFTK